MEFVWRDLIYALRNMRRRPMFAVTAVLTLALAIGGNTAMFTIVRTVLLKPLPYPDADRLMAISGGATITRFHELRESQRAFAGVAAYAGEENATLSTSSGEPEVLKGVRVSANFLNVLNVVPLLGRSFRAQEDTPGGAGVVMISAELWRRRWGGRSDAVGRPIDVDGVPYTVVGILPPHFAFPSEDVAIWKTRPEEWSQISAKSRVMSPFLSIFGRLRPDVTREQANAEMETIRSRYRSEHPAMLDAKSNRPEAVVPLKENLVGRLRSMLLMLLGAVGFVLLIACANLASLLLARATSRSSEIAVRAAVGANRSRLVAQLVDESLTLSVCGGLVGMIIALWSLRGIPGVTAVDLPRAQEVHMDLVVLLFALLLSLATGVLFGLVPALYASRPDLIRALRVSGPAANQGFGPKQTLTGFNFRGTLLVGQVALSMVLLIATSLMIQSVRRLRNVPVGFIPRNVLTASVVLSPTRYDASHKQLQFFRELVMRLRAVPGVRSASAAMTLPMAGYAGSPVQDAAKPALRLNERPIATIDVVTPDYFRTLGIRLRRGRDFTDRDDDQSSRVAIIDEALAHRFWPQYPQGQDPLRQHLFIGGVDPRPAEIIGIVEDVRQDLENTAWPGTVYVPFAQHPQMIAALAVRTDTSPLSFTSAVRKEVHRIDRNEGVASVRTMEQLMDEQVGERRLLSWLLGCFALMALFLVLVGIYGVISYSVTQRAQEMGIRRALGAQRWDILSLVLGQSLRFALAGVLLGLIGAFLLTRLLESMLFEISATDPLTFGTVAVVFILVALLASYIPARRAAKIEPAAALRS